MTSLPLLMARLTQQPLLCTPEYVEVVFSVLSERFGIETSIGQQVTQTYKRPAKNGYVDKANGIAVVPIVGGLSHRSDLVAPDSGLVGYTGLHNLLSDYRANYAIRGILLDMDTPGGEAQGVDELASLIAEIAKEKPVYAVANGMIASAGVWLVSGASRIYSTPQGSVGSIGVVTSHVDRSKEMERKGQKVTFIHAGKYKVAGNPYEALPEDIRESVQARVDALYGQFVSVVSERRGIDAQVIRKTEATMLSPEKAQDIGLIDGIGTFTEVMRALVSRVNGSTFSATGPTASAQSLRQAQTQESNMTERLLYGEADLSKARGEGKTEGLAEAARKTEDAVKAAQATMAQDMATAVSTLFPDNARAAAFSDAIADGVPVATAQKVAARVEAKPAPDAAAKTATETAVDRILAANTANIKSGNAAAQLSDRDKRIAELSANIGSMYGKR